MCSKLCFWLISNFKGKKILEVCGFCLNHTICIFCREVLIPVTQTLKSQELMIAIKGLLLLIYRELLLQVNLTRTKVKAQKEGLQI